MKNRSGRFSNGWVRVFREDVFDHLGGSFELLGLFSFFLLSANVKRGRRKIPWIYKQYRYLEAGQVLTGFREVANLYEIPLSSAVSMFKKLELMGFIKIESGRGGQIGTIVTVERWIEHSGNDVQTKNWVTLNRNILNDKYTTSRCLTALGAYTFFLASAKYLEEDKDIEAEVGELFTTVGEIESCIKSKSLKKNYRTILHNLSKSGLIEYKIEENEFLLRICKWEELIQGREI
jgi:hypothetical protein